MQMMLVCIAGTPAPAVADDAAATAADVAAATVAQDAAATEGARGLVAAGATAVQTVTVAADPTAVDGALDELGDRRLVIQSDLAGLQLTLSRLMRRGALAEVDTAVLPSEPIRYLHGLGLPTDRAGQLAAALRPSTLVGVIKDDSGGLCVDHATVEPWPDGLARGSGEPGWWLRAVVDDQRLCDGPARSVHVQRNAPGDLTATVRLGRTRWGRPATRTLRGRSLQLACDEALITQDGLGRERARTKRTFWSEPLLWRVALPSVAD